MRSTRRLLLVLFIGLSSSAVVAQSTAARVVKRSGDAGGPPSIVITFAADTLRVSGGTSGGAVVLFGVERTVRDDFSEAVTIWNERLTDDDRDGEVSLTLQKPLSPFTVMAAIDESDGRYVIATPGFIPLTIAAAGKLHPNAKGEPIEFQNAMAYAEAFLVSPGKGAWLAHVFDGTGSDGDGNANGRVSVRFAAMKASRGRPDTPGPDHLLPRDLVIVINPMTLAVYADDVRGK